MDRKLSPLVVDIGSFQTKVGFGGDDRPRSIFPTIYGSAKHPGILVGIDPREAFCGFDAVQKRGILGVRFPVREGIIQNWNQFEKIMKYGFENQLNTDPQGHSVLFTESPMNPSFHREKLFSLSFEGFQFVEMRKRSRSERAKIYAPENREISTWVGGSVLTTFSSFSQNWVTKSEYNEYGASIVHRKCQ